MGNKHIILLALTLFFFTCKPDVTEPKSITPSYLMPTGLSKTRPNLNLNILVDLSDRIDPIKFPAPAMDYYLRDVGYIRSIAEAFEIHTRMKQTNLINEKLKLFIDPSPTDKTIDSKLESLKTNFDRFNAKRDSILNTSIKYNSTSKFIYEKAIKDNNYIGSDIWGFFKNRIEDYCIETGKRNILVILTDGFIYHKDNIRKEENRTSYITPIFIKNQRLNVKNWNEKININDFGFIVPNVNLENLEVLVLGVNAQQSRPYGEDIIMQYWKDWLSNMSVKKMAIKLNALPTNIDKIIKDFILNE